MALIGSPIPNNRFSSPSGIPSLFNEIYMVAVFSPGLMMTGLKVIRKSSLAPSKAVPEIEKGTVTVAVATELSSKTTEIVPCDSSAV